MFYFFILLEQQTPLQTDICLRLRIKLNDHVPTREIETETEAKSPNASLLIINEITPFSEEIQPVVDDQFISQLKISSLYNQFSAKQPSDKSDVKITRLFSLYCFGK